MVTWEKERRRKGRVYVLERRGPVQSSHLQIFSIFSPANFSPCGVVDRPCPVLARQCRKKRKNITCKFFHLQSWNGAFSPAVFFWQIFHMQFWDDAVQSYQIPAKKIINFLFFLGWLHGSTSLLSGQSPLNTTSLLESATKVKKGGLRMIDQGLVEKCREHACQSFEGKSSCSKGRSDVERICTETVANGCKAW